ncbi:MAG: MBL fold metallo-hydrolase [Methanobrevibacter sp.]|uniref:MBL fold metallo-hydrolase n=1 Tax=Methanobrevibacter sp. TaxID=66852 RepID=UPI0026DF498B|nr:MBL fold metallo-hydrolase [Methanobrevibacter sp.]MDO5849203.1 MBL fold metallo-hydrolase [Methanobrevibacter sp.]
MKVVVLVENSSKDNLRGEHGLSFYIEHKGKRYLIDAGKSNLFLENSNKLNVDLAGVDMAFLSHAHYDHSGGFEEFFKINESSKVYLQNACRQKEYYKIVDSRKKYIGIPKGLLKNYDDRFEFVDGFKKVSEDVFICPHNSKDLALRGKRAHMYGILDGEVAVDDFSHEQTIVFKQDDGLFLFNSCSHGGVENIIDEVRAVFPNYEIMAFFGGFHMMGVDGVDSCEFSENEVKEIGKSLLKDTDATFYTGHCTGDVATEWLGEILGDKLVNIHSGMIVDL